MNLELLIVATVDQSPDAPAGAISPGMSQRNFVVPNDAVIEIGNVKCAVRAELRIYRTKPRILRADQMRHCLSHLGAAELDGLVPKDGARHHIAYKKIVAKLFRPKVVSVTGDTVERSGSPLLFHH